MCETPPQAVRIRPSGDPARPVEIALDSRAEPAPGTAWGCVHSLTRAQARTVLLAVGAELSRALPIVQGAADGTD